MASIRRRLERAIDVTSLGDIPDFVTPMHDARERLAEQTRRAWKQRKALHKCYTVVHAMDIEKWQLISLNHLLRGAIIEQEVRIQELETELLKHKSVIH